jgi:hypothetical protein
MSCEQYYDLICMDWKAPVEQLLALFFVSGGTSGGVGMGVT